LITLYHQDEDIIKRPNSSGSNTLTKQVADLVGVDPSTIRNWEYGKGMDMFAKLAKLCEVLECSPAELFEVKEVR